VLTTHRKAFILVAALIVLSIAFGGLSHSLIPHEHSHDAGRAELMHAALRHEEKKLIDVGVFALLSIISLIAASSRISQRSFALRALIIRAGGAEMAALRRGVIAYRKFG